MTSEYDTIYEYEYFIPDCELAQTYYLQSMLANDTFSKFINSNKMQRLINNDRLDMFADRYQYRDILVKVDLKNTMLNDNVRYDDYRFLGYYKSKKIFNKWHFTDNSHIPIEANDFIDFKLDMLTNIFQGFRPYFIDENCKIITDADVVHFDKIIKEKLQQTSPDWRLTPEELFL